MMRLALAGSAERVKVLEGLMVRVAVDPAVRPFSEAVTDPVAAPAGMTKVRVVAFAVESGAESVPPDWAAKVIAAAVPVPEMRFVPVTVTMVPVVPDFGLKSDMVGAAGAAITVTVAAAERRRRGVTARAAAHWSWY